MTTPPPVGFVPYTLKRLGRGDQAAWLVLSFAGWKRDSDLGTARRMPDGQWSAWLACTGQPDVMGPKFAKRQEAIDWIVANTEKPWPPHHSPEELASRKAELANREGKQE